MSLLQFLFSCILLRMQLCQLPAHFLQFLFQLLCFCCFRFQVLLRRLSLCFHGFQLASGLGWIFLYPDKLLSQCFCFCPCIFQIRSQAFLFCLCIFQIRSQAFYFCLCIFQIRSQAFCFCLCSSKRCPRIFCLCNSLVLLWGDLLYFNRKPFFLCNQFPAHRLILCFCGYKFLLHGLIFRLCGCKLLSRVLAMVFQRFDFLRCILQLFLRRFQFLPVFERSSLGHFQFPGLCLILHLDGDQLMF